MSTKPLKHQTISKPYRTIVLLFTDQLLFHCVFHVRNVIRLSMLVYHQCIKAPHPHGSDILGSLQLYFSENGFQSGKICCLAVVMKDVSCWYCKPNFFFCFFFFRTVTSLPCHFDVTRWTCRQLGVRRCALVTKWPTKVQFRFLSRSLIIVIVQVLWFHVVGNCELVTANFFFLKKQTSWNIHL